MGWDHCLNLCSYPDSPFYETKIVIDGYPISLFNYRLATNTDFEKKFAKELRGICFVFNKDGSLFKRYLLLDKFFNLNQTKETAFDAVKNYEIKSVNNKEDGSLATFVKLPNGRVIAKSKMGFDNDQAIAINVIYKSNSVLRELVNFCLDAEIIPVFEYVSPFNRIVLKYKNDELILLKIRCNLTGRYYEINNLPDQFNEIKKAPVDNPYKNLEELVEFVSNQVEREGVVVHCKDELGKDFLFKVKTKWYIALHSLYTQDLNRENILIDYILNEKVDDLLAQLDENDLEIRERVQLISTVIKKEINIIVDDIERLYTVFLDMGSNRKDFALKYLNVEPMAKFVFQRVKAENSFDLAKSYLSEKTKKLSLARDFLKSVVNIEFKDVVSED